MHAARHPAAVSLAIGAMPGEAFADTGCEFKKRSPFARSFLIELNHSFSGYLPPRRHSELGGYEPWLNALPR